MAITPEKRSKLVHLLNIGTAEIPNWAFINEGVTELTEEFNPDINSLQYIGEDAATSYVRRYEPSISLTAVMISGDPVNAWIQNIVNTLPVGSAADTQYIRFNLLDSIATMEENTKKYYGYLRNASVSVDDIGGAAGEEVEMNVTLSGRGSQTLGVVEITTDTSGKATNWKFSANEVTSKVKFKVTSSASPVSGATVTLCTGGSKQTSEAGEAEFSVTQNKKYLYSVEMSGKQTATGQVEVKSEATVDCEVSLEDA